MKFLIVLAIAGMAVVGCSSSKNANSMADSGAMDTNKMDSPMVDTTKTVPDTTNKVPDTTKNQ
ncbi:MAG: hypothetical protein EOO91_09310 [Pedobacter sp.]|nr:MAG: hypothetical protein EOO91_09310 [Pedobacter sp.]